MKTYKEWYKDLPNPYGQMAIDAFNEQPGFARGGGTTSLSVAILDGFDWSDTKHGDRFWNHVYDYAKGREKNLPILELEL